ncbi:NAD(P)-dependent oxidoreductase [Streptomyces sp. BPTC-684]|uniref:NAD-dependent epimerase/dehydratase family protein n=1 Tax=Streptomyces sp. BPTC-684 TaxID=3043734 RepID=UPI0024B03D86|nr:NAD(P)-dependent oxidoreductase [Streptomyces sp. BPTC-684]WHM36512.1 NAD(P)-dependent oxidoreductase [Streptomyces sp. BPTC-684]
MSRRVVVLGGNGVLGSRVCQEFAAAGWSVLSVSRSGGRAPWWSDDIASTALDLSTVDAGGLRRALAGADVVVNAAAVVWRTTDEAMRALHVEFVDRLIDVAADLGPRLVQLGSSYEYGPAEFGVITTEDDRRPPTSGYGVTKRRSTEAVRRAAQEHRVDGVVLRVANVAGPGAGAGSLPGMVARRLAAGEERLPLSPLTCWRDYVDVRDVIDAVLAAATAPAADVSGQVINIAGGNAVPVRELVHRLIALSGVPAQVVVADRTVLEPMPWQQLDISRARRLLGWRPARKLDDSLADMLAAERESASAEEVLG